MNMTILAATLIPLAGTTIGAAFVYFLKKNVSKMVTRIMAGFAAGVMSAASVWSLLIPAIEQSEKSMGQWGFLPAFIGFWIGILLLLAMDTFVPHIHPENMKEEGRKSKMPKNAMLLFAVTLHNVPEGMAIGAVLAGMSAGNSFSTSAAMALAIGIAIQNIPEGAIISMPLKSEGKSRNKSFLFGFLSGVVEPAAAWLTLLLSHWISSVLPVFLAFAAGAMMYVVVEELIPEMGEGVHSNAPALFYALGFSIMMALDVALG